MSYSDYRYGDHAMLKDNKTRVYVILDRKIKNGDITFIVLPVYDMSTQKQIVSTDTKTIREDDIGFHFDTDYLPDTVLTSSRDKVYHYRGALW